MKRINIWLFMAIVIAIPLSVFAVVTWYERSFQKLPVLINEKHKVADYNLLNQDGKKSTTKEWENKIVVANYFFTHCPTVCPAMTRNLVKVQQASRDKNILFVSFSVDPETDSSQVLKNFVRRFKIDESNWQFLTGSKIEIYHLARKSFQVIATNGDGGPNDFIHSDKLILIDRQKRIRGYYGGRDEKEVAQLITDIKKLENEP